MSKILHVLTAPNKLLSEKSQPIEDITPEIKELASNMLYTMYEAPGIGLAAPQVGHNIRLVTIDVSTDEQQKNPRIMINPRVLWTSEESNDYLEGCLSVPQANAVINRPKFIKAEYTNLDGDLVEVETGGLLATCIQHEIDHLNGVLFIDLLSRLKREMCLKKMKKFLKNS